MADAPTTGPPAVRDRDLERHLREMNDALLVSSVRQHELTEQAQKSEEALRVTAGLLRAATDNASVGLVSLDLERRYTFANPAYCKILGLPADIIGKGPAEMLPSVYAEQIAPSLDLAYAGQRVANDLRRPVPDSADGKFNCFSVVYEPERDGDGNIIGVVVVIFDITERVLAEEKIRLLMGEVNHRAKNLLAVVQAIARQTARSSDPTTFAILLSERLRGLAQSQDLLIKNHWKCVELSELVHAQLSHFSDFIGSRLLFEGPSVSLSPGAAQGIGMALHELATNAAKYGALSNGVGRVRVNWDTGVAPEPVFTMQWLEEGGPEVAPPGRKGFGHQVIERMVEASVEGKVEIEYRKAGLFWKLAAPATHLLWASGNER